MKYIYITTIIIFSILLVSCDNNKVPQESTTDLIEIETTSNTAAETVLETNLDSTELPELYIKPKLVSPEKFDFGDYYLLACDVSNFYREDELRYEYILLGGNIADINAGKQKIGIIQNKYYKKYDIPEGTYWGTKEQQVDIKKILSERQIVGISEDGKRVLCFSYIHQEGQHDFFEYWDRLYEIYEEDKLLKNEHLKPEFSESGNDEYYTARYNLNGYFIYGCGYDNKWFTSYYNLENNVEISVNNFMYGYSSINFNKENYIYYDSDKKKYVLISLKTGDVIGEYSYGDRDVLCYSENGKILLSSSKKDDKINKTYNTPYNEGKVYIADIDGSNEKYLGNYMFNPILSPDGKYLAYTSYDSQDNSVSEQCQEEMPLGYYIKNLETGDTVYYESTVYPTICGFINKSGADSLLEYCKN